MDDLRTALRKALSARFGVKGEIDDDTGLFSGGLIDSLSVMDLVGYLEQEIGRSIPPKEITFDNFDSINRIVRFAASLSTPRAGA